MTSVPAERLSIGEMSRRTLLSARALRHYDAIGLLRPAVVDERTGYRFYEPYQIVVAAQIRRLRDLGVPLDDVAAVLDDRDVLERVLVERRDAIERQVAADTRALAAINRWLDQGVQMSFTVMIKNVPPESVATFRWRGQASDPELFDFEPWVRLTSAIAAAGGRLASTIGIANVFELDGIADMELGYVTDELLPPGDGYVSRVLDGGEFATVTFERLVDKPAAYEELWRWMGERGMTPRGPSRECGPLVVGMGPPADDASFVEPNADGWPVEILLPV